jgi:hypothetical protein
VNSKLVPPVVFLLVGVGCRGGPVTPAATPTELATCSAAGLSAELESQAGLPAPVAGTRLTIAEAAVACDYERLEELALAGGDFIYSFGGNVPPTPGEAAGFWRDEEERGSDTLANLVNLLELPYAKKGGDYVWPSAFKDDPTDADWEALEAIYSAEEIAGFQEFGGYAGLRVGISPDGGWKFFVGGD